MNIEEYNAALKAIEVESQTKRVALNREFASANNPVKIGDIVEDHYHIIKVESIVVVHGGIPSCMYKGPELKKDGTPKKNQKAANNALYQCNLKSINGAAIGIGAGTTGGSKADSPAIAQKENGHV